MRTARPAIRWLVVAALVAFGAWLLIVGAFNIQWPTLPTVLMAPVLIAMYVRLARREDLELATFFAEAFLESAARTPAVVPWGRRVDRRLGTTAGGVPPALPGVRR